jgi:dihydrofolate reductase
VGSLHSIPDAGCMDRKVIVYIATSLDGYIALPDDDLSFLDIVQKEGEDYGYNAFIHSVDTVIMGRKTYDWVMKQVAEFPHADKTAYILTRTSRPAEGKTTFYTGDVKALVLGLKMEAGKGIFVDGGAEVVNALLQHDLIDEFIISVIPVIVGSGTRLFGENNPQVPLRLLGSKAYDTGLLQVHYSRRAVT